MPAECVKVIVRVRPFNQREKDNASKPCLVVHENSNSIDLVRNSDNDVKSYTFDYVFGPEIPQLQIYQQTAFNLVESVAEGYNGTIFAYGQTGCGKTFTMMGDPSNDNFKGIIPRTFEQIINIIDNKSDTNKKFLLRCSYLEIYNEEIHDLLSKDVKQRYDLKEGQQGVYIKDLHIPSVKTIADMDKYMLLGSQNRSIGATSMNKESSRSHCIFTVYIECMVSDDQGSERITAGKLNLVDLAGSERQSKTQATGDRLKEATKINLSLSALGNVISALVDGKTSHIPYRDSKLTRLLQDSLGGNTKTIMITAISPSDFNFDETHSSLRYASRAKMIKNQPKINEDPKDAMLKEQAQEIKKLREMLSQQVGIPSALGSKQNDEQLLKLKEENEKLMEMMKAKGTNKTNQQDIQEYQERHHQLVQGKEKYEKEMREKEQQAEQERQARQRLEELLKEKEQMVLEGGRGTDDSKRKYHKMQEAIDQQKKEHEELIQLQEQQQQEMLQIENRYQSVQDEVEKLRKQVKFFKRKYDQQCTEQAEMKQEYEYEKEELLDSIRSQEKEVKLYQGILNMILQQEEIDKIVIISEWIEDANEYKIPSFNLRANKINFPNLPQKQAKDLIELEKLERSVEIYSRVQQTSSFREASQPRRQSPKSQRKSGEQHSRNEGNSQYSVDKAMMVVEKAKQNQQILEMREVRNKIHKIEGEQQLQKRINQKVILNPIDNRGNTVPDFPNQTEIPNNENNGNCKQITPPVVKKNYNLQPLEQKPPTGRQMQKIFQKQIE